MTEYLSVQLKRSDYPDVEFVFGTETAVAGSEFIKSIGTANTVIPKGGLVACRITFPSGKVTAKDVIGKYSREFPDAKYSRSVKDNKDERIVSGVVIKTNVKDITDVLESGKVRVEIAHREFETEFHDPQNRVDASTLNAIKELSIKDLSRLYNAIAIAITDKMLEKHFIDVTKELKEKARKEEELARKKAVGEALDF